MKIYKQLIGVLGIWLLITSLFTDSLSFMIWSNTIVGFIAAIAGFRMLELQKLGGIFGLIVGIWLIHSFYFLESDMSTTTLVLNNVISGIVLVADGYFTQGSRPEAEVS